MATDDPMMNLDFELRPSSWQDQRLGTVGHGPHTRSMEQEDGGNMQPRKLSNIDDGGYLHPPPPRDLERGARQKQRIMIGGLILLAALLGVAIIVAITLGMQTGQHSAADSNIVIVQAYEVRLVLLVDQDDIQQMTPLLENAQLLAASIAKAAQVKEKRVTRITAQLGIKVSVYLPNYDASGLENEANRNETKKQFFSNVVYGLSLSPERIANLSLTEEKPMELNVEVVFLDQLPFTNLETSLKQLREIASIFWKRFLSGDIEIPNAPTGIREATTLHPELELTSPSADFLHPGDDNENIDLHVGFNLLERKVESTTYSADVDLKIMEENLRRNTLDVNAGNYNISLQVQYLQYGPVKIEDSDECSASPCMNGAQCEDLVADYTCVCMSGLTGKNCHRDTDECASNPCEHDGTCNDMINGYNCTCTLGPYGDSCEMTPAPGTLLATCDSGSPELRDVTEYNTGQLLVSGYGGVRICSLSGNHTSAEDMILPGKIYSAVQTSTGELWVSVNDGEDVKLYKKLQNGIWQAINNNNFYPILLRLDQDENLIVKNFDINYNIFKFNITGELIMDTIISDKQSYGAIPLNASSILVAFYREDCARVLHWDGSPPTTTYGTCGQEGNSGGLMNRPYQVTVDTQGRVVIVENNNKKLSVFDNNGTFIRTFLKDKFTEKPRSVLITQNNLLVVGEENNGLVKTFWMGQEAFIPPYP